MLSRSSWSLAGAMILGIAAALPSLPALASPTCIPGAQLACACPGRESGVQVCAADGKSLGACECPEPAETPAPREPIATEEPPQDLAAALQALAEKKKPPVEDKTHKLAVASPFPFEVVDSNQSVVCNGPCPELPSGLYRVQLPGRPNTASNPIMLSGDTAAVASSNAGKGVLWLTTGLLCLAGAVPLMYFGFGNVSAGNDDVGWILAGTGGTILALIGVPATIVGIGDLARPKVELGIRPYIGAVGQGTPTGVTMSLSF